MYLELVTVHSKASERSSKNMEILFLVKHDTVAVINVYIALLEVGCQIPFLFSYSHCDSEGPSW